MSKRSILCLVLLFGLGPGHAWGQRADLGVGLYMPSLPQGRSDRVRAIEQLAEFLAKQTGLKVRGLSFARRGDLESAVTRGEVHYAVVSAQYAAARRLRPTALLVRDGAAAQPFQIVAKSQVRLAALKGEPVAVVRVGLAYRKFVTNVLLEGELGADYFRWVAVPDTSSAILALRLDKAKAAVVPRGADIAGLATVFRSMPVPFAGMVAMSKPSAPVRRRLRKALVSWRGAWLGFDGWRLADSKAFASVRTRLVAGRAAKKPVASRPEPFRGFDRRVLASRPPVMEVPSPLPLLSVPSGKPDVDE